MNQGAGSIPRIGLNNAMQDIKELAYILNQHSLPVLNGNGQPLEKDTLLWRLYEGIEKGQFLSDEEAELALYPRDAGSNTKYRKLKSALRDRMLSTVVSFEPKGGRFTDYQKAYYECHREWHIIKILSGQNANTAAMGLAVKLLKQVQKYEFTLLTMDIAAYLAYQYGLRESNDKKFREANDLYTKGRILYDAECLAEQLYTELMVKVVNNRSVNQEVAQLASRYYARIEEQMKEYHSYRLHLYGQMISLMRYSTINQYDAVLPICEKAIAYFEQKPYEARIPLQMFSYQKMICHIQLRSFDEGKKVANYCLSLIEEGNFNWFKYMELYLQLAFYTQEYGHGVEVIKKAISHPRFQFLPENTKELWRIYESFAYFLTKTNQIQGGQLGKFKLNKFMNETPIFSKDKSGMNIAIIVVRLLFLLAEKSYKQILDEVEAIEQYCYRYLTTKNTVRSASFIKMLLQIPHGQFDASLVSKKAAKYRKVLDDYPLQVANQTHEVEVIPYEELWEMVLPLLRK